jgi:hypothetical protein
MMQLKKDAPVEEVSEEVEVGGDDAVEEAVETIELALEEIKDAVGCEDGDVDGDVEDTTDFVADEVNDSVVEVEEDEVLEEEEAGAGCFATKSGKFERLAKVSPEVQKEIADYWKNDLGYPADYVDLMFKNYE